MEKENRVIAVVVTYNRKELLMECLDAILAQTFPVYKIILIDNCSTDGTDIMLSERGYIVNPIIEYIKLNENTGGAGGFYEGMRIARQKESYDWMWIMDDDTIPEKKCLEELINANNIVKSSAVIEGLEESVNPSFFASAVYGTKGEFMNLPKLSNKKAPNGYSYWYQFLSEGMVNISSATFVSVLFSKEAIDKCGLPCKDFFIWGDDSEYTTRLTTYYGNGYFVGKSIAIHKRAVAKPIAIKNEQDPKRMDMYHYKYRNTAIINRYYSPKYHISTQLLMHVLECLNYLGKRNGIRISKIILKGFFESLVQYKSFKKYIDSQIK